MTDGQSFYLLFAIFYLIECIKFAPPDSIAFVSRTGSAKLSPRFPLLMAWGFKKSVFLAEVLPWPGRLYITTGYKSKSLRSDAKVQTVASVRRHHHFLTRATRNLHYLSLLNICNFFILLPTVYVRTYDERAILLTLAFGYASLVGTGIHYHKLHKRLFPSAKADRFKTTLYTSLLPWHSIRCVDEIYQRSAALWSPIAAIAASSNTRTGESLLRRHWREAHFHPKPTYTVAELSPMLRQLDLDVSDWLDAPTNSSSPKYCPSCHSEYEEQATHCSDCEGVALKKS